MHFSVFVHVVILCALRGALTIQATPFEFTNFSILSDNNKRQFRYDKLFSSSHSLYVQLCIQYKLLMALKVIRNEFNKRWHFCIDASTIAFVKYSALFLVIFEINCIVTWCKRMYYFAVSFFFAIADNQTLTIHISIQIHPATAVLVVVQIFYLAWSHH